MSRRHNRAALIGIVAVVTASCVASYYIGRYDVGGATESSHGRHPEVIAVHGELYEINAPNRPGCFVEPSATVEGFEVIFYPDMGLRNDIDLGFEVSCPEPATIGGTTVPPLDCEEDEIIAFKGHGPTPYPLVCINIQEFVARENSR